MVRLPDCLYRLVWIGALAGLVAACSPTVPGPDRAPVAIAGGDRVVAEPGSITLDGSASFDPDGDPIEAYRWRILAAPDQGALEFSGAADATAVLDVQVPGTWVVALTVEAAGLMSQRDVIQVRSTGGEPDCRDDVDCDDQNPCTDDLCAQGVCQNPNVLNGEPCDDGDWCTTADGCQVGQCQGSPRDCSVLDDQCNMGVCDPAQTACVPQPFSDGAPCDDSLYCTVGDECSAGVCAGGPRDCSAVGDACNDGVCQEATDSCESQQKLNGTACDDSDACTMNDVCSTGVCVGAPKDLDGDGYSAVECGFNDCDDTNALVNPGQFEGAVGEAACLDALDNDCDGLTDDQDQTCLACATDPDCDDANQCNGLETCAAPACVTGIPLECDDTNPCTDDTCLPASGCSNQPNVAPCDDEEFCTLNDSCDAGNCIGSGTPCSTECQGVCDEPTQACLPDTQGTQCADNGLYCDGAEVCDGIGNCGSEGSPCPDTDCNHCFEPDDSCVDPAGTSCTDDGLFCNGPEVCDGFGLCESGGNPCAETECEHCNEGSGDCYDLVGTLCTDDQVYCNGVEACDGLGTCASPGNPCLETDCNHCEETAGTCFDPPGTACTPDGYDCTADVCDGAGNCASTGDDSWCEETGPGGICRPVCFGGIGCGQPPAEVNLTCLPSWADPGQQDTSACTLDLGLAGQGACLSCSARFGLVVLEQADFGDLEGACQLDGWRLVVGDFCRDSYDTVCDPGSSNTRTCCADAGSVCANQAGFFGLETNEATNCGSNVEEWRATKRFDTRGLHSLEVCLEVSESSADANEALFLIADNGSEVDTVFCLKGEPLPGIDDVVYRVCEFLPVMASNQAVLDLTLVAHSEDWNDRYFVNGLTLKGWASGCGPDYATAMVEDFEGCTADWGEWTTAGDLTCVQDWQCFDDSNRVRADNSAGTLTRTVDTTELDGDVNLCFHFGDHNAGAGETLDVFISPGAGAGWTQVLDFEGNTGTNDQCREFCIDLSAIDARVHNNPGLVIRFDLASNNSGARIDLDHVVVKGARNCADDQVVGLTGLQDNADGSYSFTAQDVGGDQLAADVRCVWADLGSGYTDEERVDFLSSPYASWIHRRQLSFDNLGRPEVLVDFPVPVILNQTRIDYGVMDPDGLDLLFLADDGLTVLPHEVERWEDGGTSVVWVRVPFIPMDSDSSFIWMLYGNPDGATSEFEGGVWDDHFFGVYHLDETATNGVYDSSLPHSDGTHFSSPSVQVDGALGDWATDFDGSDDFVSLGALDVAGGNGDDGISLEVIAKKESGGTVDCRLISKSNGNQPDSHWWMLSLDDPSSDTYRLRFRLKPDGEGTTTLSTPDRPVVQDEWFYAVATYDGQYMRIYFNGSEVVSYTLPGSNPVATNAGVQAAIGANYISHYGQFSGPISEARISDVARSAHWIAAQNQAVWDDPADPFVLWGPEDP